MKRTTAIACAIICLLLATNVKGQQTNSYSTDKISVKYTTTNDRLTGSYTCSYTNQKTRATGNLINGYKTGLWKFYDTTGTLQIERNYLSNLAFESIIPKTKQPSNKLNYNEKGFIEYQKFQQSNVLWQKRVWRTIEKGQNPLIFENDKLYASLCNAAKEGELAIYDPSNDEFTSEIEYYEQQYSNLQVVKFKVKEDWFFDAERGIMEGRIIGICPVALDQQKETDLFWVYMPETRPILANVTTQNAHPPRIKTLDDLFFFRDFSSSIYKVVEQSATGKKEAQKQLTEKVTMEIIDMETELLLKINQEQ